MRISIIFIAVWTFTGYVAAGQKPVASATESMFRSDSPNSFSPFSIATIAKNDYSDHLGQSQELNLSSDVLQQITRTAPALLRLQLPSSLNIELDLYRATIYSSGAQIKTSSGEKRIPNPKHLFYRGMIHGDPNSLAIVSVFEDDIHILYTDENGNKRIQKNQDGTYVLFEDEDILIPKTAGCFVGDEEAIIDTSPSSSQRSMTGNCVEVYVEADFKSYQDNGSSVSATEAWIAALWNEVITLYANEAIPVLVSDMLVYTTSDPFAGLGSTSAVLTAFSNHIDTLTYNGRLAHFLSTRSLGGGIAYLNVLCSNSNPCAVSASLSTNIQVFPTYSWNVEVVTHEMGHNMGSPHTHACAWNGNNTQIDDCGNQWAANNGSSPEGSACYNSAAPIIPASGTIMSYCHLIGGVGINFNNGFGPLPGNLIRTQYNSAACNTGSCSPPLCSSLTQPLPDAINVDINQNLSWGAVSGANGFRLSIGTSPGGTEIVNNFDAGLVTTYDPVNPFNFNTLIYVSIIPYNELGDASGCSNQSFRTELNTIPLCTTITYPQSGGNNIPLTAIIQWAHATGNQIGYKISIGTTLNGTDIANNVNVGNNTSYDPPGYLPPSSTIYVKITPYGANGDVPGCASQSFTTITPVNGDFCFMAISLACGQSVSGNTSLAYNDQEAFTCGTPIEAPGIWFTFVGNGQNTVLSTCAQYGYDVKMNAYSGTCANFTCITGNDDFCNTGSLISFPTLNGTTYYVLVQGWQGATGTFTLTRTCYSGLFYCPTQGINASQEWIKTFSLGSLTKQSASSNYSDFTNEIITVSRGGSYPVTITPQWLQSARSEYYRVWIDLNIDGDFSDAGEQVFSAGPSLQAVSGNIIIPVTATKGTTRMRVSMRYNQAPPFCDAYSFGEVEDYSLNIRCNMVTSLDETTNGSLRNVSTCADDNESILFAPALNNQTIIVSGTPLTSDGLWKWMPDPGTNIKIQANGISRLLSIPATRSVEMQNLELIGGTATDGSTIDNSGSLILRNSKVRRAIGSSSIPLRNKGDLTVQGNSDVRF